MKIILMLCLLVFGVETFAQVADPVVDVPTWIQTLMLLVQSIPGVGPYVLTALKWLGFAASILTAVSAFLMALQVLFSSMEKLTGIGAIFTKINGFIAKIMPYVKYLSVFNAKKDPAKA